MTKNFEAQQQTRMKTNQIQPSAIDHITHEIVNQLSIICLCCCELRTSVGEKLEPDQLKDFQRIEGAVQDAAKKIQQLKALAQDTALRVTLEDWHRP